MTGLVLELQRDALNSEIKVSNLLQKALVVSKKLGIIEIEEWLNKELNGYYPEDEIPKYRTVRSEVKVFDSYQWQSPIFKDFEMAEKLSQKLIITSIKALELEFERGEDKSVYPFDKDTENRLMALMRYPRQLTLFIDRSEILGILETVRNKILDWSLELEQKGILGKGMSFSNDEKKLAHQTTYQITNNIGSMHNSQLQQDSAGATQSLNITTNPDDLKNFVEELKNSIESLKLEQEQTQELKEAIATLEIQANSTKPKQPIIRESLHTVRNVLEGTTGSIVASGLIYQLGLFLSQCNP